MLSVGLCLHEALLSTFKLFRCFRESVPFPSIHILKQRKRYTIVEKRFLVYFKVTVGE